jgi:hypothetical protein
MPETTVDQDPLFIVDTPLGFSASVTQQYWRVISEIKHPVMRHRLYDVRQALVAPNQVRQSRRDPSVYLFYHQERPRRWTCAVAKRLDGNGFLITAYPTDAIKEGTQVWPR